MRQGLHQLVERHFEFIALTETWAGHNQLSPDTPGLLSLGNPQSGKLFVAGWIAFIHCQQTLIANDKRLDGIY
jgi:hypothetical protein